MITKIGKALEKTAILYQKGYDRLLNIIDRYKDDADGIMDDPEAELITYGVIPGNEYSAIANAFDLEDTYSLPGRLQVSNTDLSHILRNHVNMQYNKKKTKYNASQLADYFKQINDRIDSGKAQYHRLPSISKNDLYYTNQVLLPLDDLPLLDDTKVPISYLQVGDKNKEVRVRTIYPNKKRSILSALSNSNSRYKIQKGAQLIFRNDDRYNTVFRNNSK